MSIYFILFMIYSFMGWLYEFILTIFTEKKIINRGFLFGPFCPLYGTGCLLLVICLKDFIKYPIILFILSLLICSLLEYVVGYLMEKLFKMRWWDYSHLKFNLNGYICLRFMLVFGILGTVINYFVHPFFVSLLNTLSNQVLSIISIILMIIFIIDVCLSTFINIKIKGSIVPKTEDNTEEIKQKIKEFFSKKR